MYILTPKNEILFDFTQLSTNVFVSHQCMNVYEYMYLDFCVLVDKQFMM